MLVQDSELPVIADVRPAEQEGEVVFQFRRQAATKPWLEPLLEAAAQHGISNTWSAGRITTKWDPSLPDNEEDADEERHSLYASHMASVIADRMPPLLPLMNAAGATLLVSPGSCFFTVPARIGEVFDIEELKPDTLLVPWPNEEDAPQSH